MTAWPAGRTTARSVSGRFGRYSGRRAQPGSSEVAAAARTPYGPRATSGRGGVSSRKRAAARASAVPRSSAWYWLIRSASSASVRGGSGTPELHGDPGHVGDVPVAARLVQRLGPEPGVRPQEAVRLGDMDPGQQLRVRGGVGTAVRGGPGDAAMDGPDPLGRRLRVAGPAERGDGEEIAGSLQPSPRVAAVAGMRVHARHGQRVQRLEQQGADPAHEHRRVPVHPPDGTVLGEPAVTLGLVDDLAAVRSLGTGHLLEDRGADTAPDGISGSLHSHLLSITGPQLPAVRETRVSRCDPGCANHSFASLTADVLSWWYRA